VIVDTSNSILNFKTAACSSTCIGLDAGGAQSSCLPVYHLVITVLVPADIEQCGRAVPTLPLYVLKLK
jgi:hypothetical protein